MLNFFKGLRRKKVEEPAQAEFDPSGTHPLTALLPRKPGESREAWEARAQRAEDAMGEDTNHEGADDLAAALAEAEQGLKSGGL
jgi:hypothetical protein